MFLIHKRVTFFLSFTLFVVGIGTIPTEVRAQIATAEEKTYILSAGEWGRSQRFAVRAAEGKIVFTHPGSGLAIVKSENPDFLNEMLKSGTIAQGIEDFTVEWLDSVDSSDLSILNVTPADESFINMQWNLRAMEVFEAWDLGYTGAGVRVAVIDTGIYSSHADLSGSIDIAASRSFVPGYAFNEETGTVWHATAVSGVIAARDNGFGTIGVAPDATIISVKVLHANAGALSGIISGILYAATPVAEGGAGADIITMCFGRVFEIGKETASIISIMNKTVNFASSRGVLVLCGAGNEGLDFDSNKNMYRMPSMSGNGLAVAFTGPAGFAVGYPFGATDFRTHASFSNYGNSLVSLVGPGGDMRYTTPGNCTIPLVPSGSVTQPCGVFDRVVTTIRGTSASQPAYSFIAGASMATPAVAGVAALIKQRFPEITVGEWKNRLMNTADDEGKPGSDPYYGRGFVNARRAVTE